MPMYLDPVTAKLLLGGTGAGAAVNEMFKDDDDPYGKFYRQMSVNKQDLEEDKAEMSDPKSRMVQQFKDRWVQNPAPNPLLRPIYRQQDRVEDRAQNQGMRRHNRANIFEEMGADKAADFANKRADAAFQRSLISSDHGLGERLQDLPALLRARLEGSGLLGR